MRVIAIAAAVTLLGVVFMPTQGFAGLLTGGLYGLTLALGVTVFVAIHSVTSARWWHPVKDECLAVMRALPVPAVAALAAVGFGLTALYPWARPGAMEASHLLHEKAAWLNVPFFLARAVVVIAVWLVAARVLAKAVRRAWAEPSRESSAGLVGRSAVIILVLALSISVAFWDWAMSLEPEWFSTMYGVYGFAGAMQGGVALLVVLATLAARKRGEYPSVELQHDLGKLLFGFSFFWAYIWFCEFMLIWYANLPEETGHFVTRLSGGWAMLFWLNPVLNFAIPFLALLSARAKRHSPILFQSALVVLLGRWLDVHLLVQPSVEPSPTLPIFAAGATIAVVAMMWRQMHKQDAAEPDDAAARAHQTATTVASSTS